MIGCKFRMILARFGVRAKQLLKNLAKITKNNQKIKVIINLLYEMSI